MSFLKITVDRFFQQISLKKNRIRDSSENSYTVSCGNHKNGLFFYKNENIIFQRALCNFCKGSAIFIEILPESSISLSFLFISFFFSLCLILVRILLKAGWDSTRDSRLFTCNWSSFLAEILRAFCKDSRWSVDVPFKLGGEFDYLSHFGDVRPYNLEGVSPRHYYVCPATQKSEIVERFYGIRRNSRDLVHSKTKTSATFYAPFPLEALMNRQFPYSIVTYSRFPCSGAAKMGCLFP